MKGQGALEYLMTWGWAVLIVVVVAAALFALGGVDFPDAKPDSKELFCSLNNMSYDAWACYNISDGTIYQHHFTMFNGTYYWKGYE